MFRKLLYVMSIFCAIFGNAVIADEMKPGASAMFENTDGETIGIANLWQGPKGVLIYVELSGISAGKHAIHIHSVGTCEPDFKASKGHINIAGAMHGLLNPEGPDNGDLPNIYADSAGSVQAEVYTTVVYLSSPMEGQANLMDEDGSALVVHAMGDDHVSQPIGGAGGRIACGVIHGTM